MWPFNLFQKKSFSAPLAAAILFEENISDTGSFQFRTLARDAYLRNTTVYACVNEIAGNIGCLKWRVEDPNTGEPMPQTPMARLLAKPNSIQKSTKSFLSAVMAYKLIDGNSFVTADGVTENMRTDGRLIGPPGQLNIHMPDKVEVEDDNGDIIGYKVHTRKGQAGIMLPPERVWHSMMFNPLNQFRGVSPLVAASLDWKANTEGKRWNFSMLMRGGRPSGILAVRNILDKETRERMQEELNNKWGGSNNAGKIFVLEDTDGGFDWKETSVTPKDADWIEGMKHMESNIAKAFQVPPEIIGDSANRTYTNYQEARKSFFTETVVPHAEIIKDELNNFLPPLFNAVGRLEINFDRNAIEAIQEDIQKRREELREAYLVGLAFPNEYRDVAGLDDLPDDQNIRVAPMNLMPISSLGATDVRDENDTSSE